MTVRTSVEVSVEIEIDRPLQAVWSYLADAERTSEWITEIVSTRVLSEGASGIGTIVQFTLEGGRSGTWEIVEWDPPRHLAWDGPPHALPLGSGRARGSHTLAEAGEGRTLLVTSYRPELIGAAVFLRPYLTRWLRRQRPKDAQTLKRVVEREGSR